MKKFQMMMATVLVALMAFAVLRLTFSRKVSFLMLILKK